jgi:hypothetical protein
MSKQARPERFGAYGYGLYQEEIDEYLGTSDDEWLALEVSRANLPNQVQPKNALMPRRNIHKNLFSII